MTRSIAAAELVQERTFDTVATSLDWTPFYRFSITPPSTEPWSVAVKIWADVDAGAAGSIRLRTGNGALTTEAAIGSFVDGVILGFELFSTTAAPVTQTLLFLEGRRTSGTGGGVHLIRSARPIVMSQPPAALAGGPLYPASYTPPAELYPPDYDPDY